MSAIIAARLSSDDVVMIAVIVALLGVLLVLVAAESALTRISRVTAQSLADERQTRSAAALARLVEQPERSINPLLVVLALCQTGEVFLAALLAHSLFGPAGVVTVFAANLVLFFVLTAAVPKTLAVVATERVALAVARPVELVVGLAPLRWLSSGLIWLANLLLRGRGLAKGPFVSEQELLGMVDEAAEHDVIDAEERVLIQSIIAFGDKVAREAMVPRPDITTIDETEAVTAALDVAIAHGYSRVPVTDRSGEDIVGLAYAKDLIRAEREGDGDLPVGDLARSVRYVPENKSVSGLMREMQAEQFHLAIVADEYGAITGIITLEDCLEELVGEIVDEYDTEEDAVQHVTDREYLIDGGLQISDLNDQLDLQLPDDDWDTLGGFVFSTLGHVPDHGEGIDHDGWRFIADAVEGRRIRWVRAIAPKPDTDAHVINGDGAPHVSSNSESVSAPSEATGHE